MVNGYTYHVLTSSMSIVQDETSKHDIVVSVCIALTCVARMNATMLHKGIGKHHLHDADIGNHLAKTTLLVRWNEVIQS